MPISISKCWYLLLSAALLSACTPSEDDHEDFSEMIVETMPDTGSLYVCTELLTDNFSRAFGDDRLFWDKRVLRVRFLEGTAYVKRKVEQYAHEWSKYAGLELIFTDREPSDIRISFDTDDGSWSYIGNSSSYVSSSRATMNFGWFDERTSETEFRRTTLHEFGHALGLFHEHQHPEVSINWNRSAVYDYYARTQDWSRADVDDNIFKKYSSTRTNAGAYDPASIMHYYIPSRLVIGPWVPRWNTWISPQDQAFVAGIYPRDDGGDTPTPTCNCPETVNVLACSDFESYDPASWTDQPKDWRRWSGTSGWGELQVYDWGKVVKLEYANQANPDILYQPEVDAEAATSWSWRMYVGGQQSAYFNMQKRVNPGDEFGAQFYFDAEGQAIVQVNNRQASFAYDQDRWLQIILQIDPAGDWVQLLVDDVEVVGWPLSWSATSSVGTLALRALNFYASDSSARFWIDDFCVGHGDFDFSNQQDHGRQSTWVTAVSLKKHVSGASQIEVQ